MINYLKKGAVALVCLSTAASAAGHNVKVGGAYLGGFNSVNTEYANEGQGTDDSVSGFNYAANLDFGFDLGSGYTAEVGLQIAADNQDEFAGGSEARLVDFVVKWGDDAKWQLGSFDTPYSASIADLTNNGAASSTPFLRNRLLDVALANGDYQTHNSVGLQYSKAYWGVDTTVVISNGTTETAANTDSDLGYVFGLSKSGLFNGLLDISGTVFAANDYGAQGGYGADTTSTVFDVALNITEKLGLKIQSGSVEFDNAAVNFDDNDANDVDANEADTTSVALTYDWSDSLSLGLRQSSYKSDSTDGSVTEATNAWGAEATRLQLAATLKLSEQANLKLEAYTDTFNVDAANEVKHSGINVFVAGTF